MQSTNHLGLFALVITWLAGSSASAYEVVRDVNDPTPRKDAIVIFQQGQGIDHLTVDAGDNTSATVLEDGRLRIRLEGDQWTNIFLKWDSGSDLPPSLDVTDYQALVVRGHLEGYARVPKSRRDKTLVDADIRQQPVAFVMLTLGENGWVTPGHITIGTADERNPIEPTDMIFPLAYFMPGPNQDLTNVDGMAFRMVGRGGQERQYDLIIEKISFIE